MGTQPIVAVSTLYLRPPRAGEWLVGQMDLSPAKITGGHAGGILSRKDCAGACPTTSLLGLALEREPATVVLQGTAMPRATSPT
jgi:hypothetical protein